MSVTPTPNQALRFGQGNTTSMNAVAQAFTGVFPPNYLESDHYLFHHRLGQNIRCAPILLGLIDDPTQDLSYPSNATLAAIGPEWWNVLSPNFMQPNNYGAAPSFPPLAAPPAATQATAVFPSGNPSSPPAGTPSLTGWPTNPPFPRKAPLL
jgi:hypothetical protein